MKVFDEKGKLFGKINIIDLLVIVVILVALLVVGIKVLGSRDKAEDLPPSSTNSADPADPSASDSDATSVLHAESKLTYTVRVTAQQKEIAERLEEYVDFTEGKKDQLMHGGAVIENAYVVDFWTEPCRYNVTSAGVVEMISAAEAEAAGLVDICLVVESIVPDAVTSKVGTLEVRIGKPHLLKTTHFEFINGITVDCVWEPVEE